MLTCLYVCIIDIGVCVCVLVDVHMCPRDNSSRLLVQKLYMYIYKYMYMCTSLQVYLSLPGTCLHV